jgi:hypothetical protein
MENLSQILTESIGATVSGRNGEVYGSIAGTMRDSAGETIEYAVLKSDEFFGRGARFFAVPALAAYIKITGDGDIILKLQKDDLQFARGVSANQCPKPNLKYGQSIFELYGYEEPSGPVSTLHSANNKKTNS